MRIIINICGSDELARDFDFCFYYVRRTERKIIVVSIIIFMVKLSRRQTAARVASYIVICRNVHMNISRLISHTIN